MQRAPAPAHGASRASVIQRALGFEIELAVLIDNDGVGIPEKTPIGLYGEHLGIVVDENASLDTVAPADEALSGGTPRHYASVVEIVTKHYPPETTEGKGKILAAIDEAKELADAIENSILSPKKRLTLSGGKFKAHSKAPTGNIFLGNPNQPAQTTDASFQATFGLELAQIGSFFKSLEYQSHFVSKHHSDIQYDEGARVRQEAAQAVKDAKAIMAAMGWGTEMKYLTFTSSGVTTRGFLVLVLQYLRMGRYFYDTDSSKPLNKNIVALLSRTDLAHIYRDLPPLEKGAIQEKGLSKLKQELLAKSNRAGAKALFNDTSESKSASGTSYDITCQKFLDNIFGGTTDGVTSEFTGFTKRPAEIIDPEEVRGRLFTPTGPVFELRNIATPPVASSLINSPAGRIPRSQWKALATYFIDLIKTLNLRSEDDQSTVGKSARSTVTTIQGGIEDIKNLDPRARLRRTTTVVKDVSGSSKAVNIYG